VKDFIQKHNLQTSEQIRYIDLVSEVGELGKEILNGTNYGKKEYEHTTNASGELGDCLFSLLALCCEMNVEAEDVLQEALEKYNDRFKRKGCIGNV